MLPLIAQVGISDDQAQAFVPSTVLQIHEQEFEKNPQSCRYLERITCLRAVIFK